MSPAVDPPPRRSWVSVGGYDFACMEEGRGEALLFVHGSLGTLLEFTPAVRHFARKYRAIAYSRRYHPPNASDFPAGEYTISGYAQDLKALLSTLRIGTGHAMHIGNPDAYLRAIEKFLLRQAREHTPTTAGAREDV